MTPATRRHATDHGLHRVPVAEKLRLLPIFLALPLQLETQYRQIALFQQEKSASPATHTGAQADRSAVSLAA